MYERNSLRLISKGKKSFYKVEELSTTETGEQSRYALLFPDLNAVQKFDQLSKKGSMTVQNFFGSYHEIKRTSFEFHKSHLKNHDDRPIYSGLLTVRLIRRKS